MRLIDMTGLKFGRYTVIRKAERKLIPSGQTKTMWECVCECGTIKNIVADRLRNGDVVSCGCHRREFHKNRLTKTGNSQTPEGRAYYNMIKRCTKPNNSRYKHYGGRGIKVCDRWLESISNFIEDMGTKPTPEHSLERIDVNGNYEPSNCKWATYSEQNFNRRLDDKNKSGIKGVFKNKRGKWLMSFGRGMIKHFDNKNDAINARKEAEKKYWSP